jgi:hypothetical protein
MCDVDYNVELNVENKSVFKSNQILICLKCNIEFIKRKHKNQKFCSRDPSLVKVLSEIF